MEPEKSHERGPTAGGDTEEHGAPIKLLRDAIKEYYRSHWIEGPREIEKREFGYSRSFGKKIEVRHVSFLDEKELNRFLRSESPLYVSYSVGYFKYPDARPMENKVMLGSDLVLEFDADEVGLFSEKDVWLCDHCGAYGFGHREKCPRCGSPVRLEVFPDPEREEKLKSMVVSLIEDFLLGDLGIDESAISVNFSGNRGYHVHISREGLGDLPKEARIELAEYVTGQSIEPLYLFGRPRVCEGVPCVEGPRPQDGGWPGRIARAVLSVLEGGNKELLTRAGLREKDADILLSMRDKYIAFIKRGLWPTPSKFPLEVWVKLGRLLAPFSGHTIDTATTIDEHRLIRLPDSIHGTTGLVAKRVSSLDNFQPYRDAVALPPKKISVYVKIAPEFEFKGRTYGPYREEEVQLPLYVAYYLIGRGVASWSLISRK